MFFEEGLAFPVVPVPVLFIPFFSGPVDITDFCQHLYLYGVGMSKMRAPLPGPFMQMIVFSQGRKMAVFFIKLPCPFIFHLPDLYLLLFPGAKDKTDCGQLVCIYSPSIWVCPAASPPPLSSPQVQTGFFPATGKMPVFLIKFLR